MRAKEFLLEYNRNTSIRHINVEKLLKAFKTDASLGIPDSMQNIQFALGSHFHPSYPELNEEQISEIVNEIFRLFETLDPTTGNKFVPWIARMYATGSVRIEDINRNNLLAIYDEAKRKNKVPPEYKDINRIKDYADFEDIMHEFVLPNMEELEDISNNIVAEKVFEDSEVVVIIPKNEAAACKYGRQTRWCTASTQGDNYFDQYNRQGKLYIIIPKNPKHAGEKYQLHFESDSFMDEDDTEINLRVLLTSRFPSLDDFFKKFTKSRVIKAPSGAVLYKTYNELHREDGPAVTLHDGSQEWWINGIQYEKEDYDALIKKTQ
jgi:hypothetical protein